MDRVSRNGVLSFQEQDQNKEGNGFSHLSPSGCLVSDLQTPAQGLEQAALTKAILFGETLTKMNYKC